MLAPGLSLPGSPLLVCATALPSGTGALRAIGALLTHDDVLLTRAAALMSPLGKGSWVKHCPGTPACCS